MLEYHRRLTPGWVAKPLPQVLTFSLAAPLSLLHHRQVVVGSDPDAHLIASLDAAGYLTYGMSSADLWTDLGVPVAQRVGAQGAANLDDGDGEGSGALPAVTAAGLREAGDRQQAWDWRWFRGVSPATADVVVCLDVAQYLVQCSGNSSWSDPAGTVGAWVSLGCNVTSRLLHSLCPAVHVQGWL